MYLRLGVTNRIVPKTMVPFMTSSEDLEHGHRYGNLASSFLLSMVSELIYSSVFSKAYKNIFFPCPQECL